MKFAWNIAAGIASSAWTALVGLLVIPLDLRYLGIASYGLVGFFATTQVLLQLLEMGLAPTLNREIARASAAGHLDDARRLVFTLGFVYLITSLLIVLAMWLASGPIATHWLDDSAIGRAQLAQAVALMGLVIACRWPLGLYQGTLMGLQRLRTSSAVNAVMFTVTNVGTVLVLAFVSPTIHAFFLWQALANLAHVAVMRAAAARAMGRASTPAFFDSAALRRIWRFSAGMTGIAISSVVLTQVDKVVLSKLLPLADLGKYTLAGVFASVLYVLLTPVFHVVYPRMSALVALGREADLSLLYRVGARLLNCLLLPLAVSGSLYAEPILYYWTGDAALAAAVAPLASLLILGTAGNGVMHFPYALQLASGATRLPFMITTSLACLSAPLVVLATLAYGARGSAAAWLCINLAYVLLGTWLTHRQLLPGLGARWLAREVALPLLLTLAVVLPGWWLLEVDGHHARNLAVGISFGLLAVLVNCLSAGAEATRLLRMLRETTIAAPPGVPSPVPDPA
jgi:O-antigen/teichoic acid export membrane protein